MKRWLIPGIVLVPLIVLPAVFASGGDAATGKAIYAKRCASCHGEKGEGKEAITKMFKVELRRLGSKEVQAKTDAELRKDITEGFGKMKPVKGLTEKEATDLIAYMRSLEKK